MPHHRIGVGRQVPGELASDLQLVDGGRITSSSVGLGSAGSVTVQADRLLISGAGVRNSSITSTAGPDAQGSAGTVAVTDRVDGDLGAMTVPELGARLEREVQEKRIRQVVRTTANLSETGAKFAD